jgi:hypothetical protein
LIQLNEKTSNYKQNYAVSFGTNWSLIWYILTHQYTKLVSMLIYTLHVALPIIWLNTECKNKCGQVRKYYLFLFFLQISSLFKYKVIDSIKLALVFIDFKYCFFPCEYEGTSQYQSLPLELWRYQSVLVFTAFKLMLILVSRGGLIKN